jgi:hypothetical protein
MAATPTVDQTMQLFIYRNGSAIKAALHRYKVASATSTDIKIEDTYYFSAGDTISIYALNEGTSPSINSSTTLNTISIIRQSGPSAIAASETIAAVYNDSAGQTFPATTTYNALTFNTKEVDTHGAFNGSTGVFTAPATGLYEVDVAMGAYGTGTVAYVDLIVTPSSGTAGNSRQVGQSSSTIVTNNVSKIWRLNAGDTVSITKGATYSTGSVFTFNSGQWNSISIKRIGN